MTDAQKEVLNQLLRNVSLQEQTFGTQSLEAQIAQLRADIFTLQVTVVGLLRCIQFLKNNLELPK